MSNIKELERLIKESEDLRNRMLFNILSPKYPDDFISKEEQETQESDEYDLKTCHTV